MNVSFVIFDLLQHSVEDIYIKQQKFGFLLEGLHRAASTGYAFAADVDIPYVQPHSTND